MAIPTAHPPRHLRHIAVILPAEVPAARVPARQVRRITPAVLPQTKTIAVLQALMGKTRTVPAATIPVRPVHRIIPAVLP